jgi:hypothetical protein
VEGGHASDVNGERELHAPAATGEAGEAATETAELELEAAKEEAAAMGFLAAAKAEEVTEAEAVMAGEAGAAAAAGEEAAAATEAAVVAPEEAAAMEGALRDGAKPM